MHGTGTYNRLRTFWGVDPTTVYVVRTDGNLYVLQINEAWQTFTPPGQSVATQATAVQGVGYTSAFILQDVPPFANLLRVYRAPWGGQAAPTESGPCVAFQALDPTTLLMLEYPSVGGALMLYTNFDGSTAESLGSWTIDANAGAFQALSQTQVYVLGSDGILWLETGPWGPIPPSRQKIDANVAAFDAVDASNVYVLGSDGILWLETGPWGPVPPYRQKIDANVADFQATGVEDVYVLGTDGNLGGSTDHGARYHHLVHRLMGMSPPSRSSTSNNRAMYLARTVTCGWNSGRGAQYHQTVRSSTKMCQAFLRPMKLANKISSSARRIAVTPSARSR